MIVFWGGGKFFWEDPLGPSNRNSGMFKSTVVWDLPKIFVGPPAGLRRLTAVPKGFYCPKMSKNRGFWTKFGRESGGLIFACSFNFQNLNYNIL